MTRNQPKLAARTGASVLIDACQVCDARELTSLLFLGYLPPVNALPKLGARPAEQPAYPAELLSCERCRLVQLGLVVDPQILFPPEYPYTSGTTRILRENFAELFVECKSLLSLDPSDLVVDVGSNDGTLLSNFKNGGHRVLGIEPTLMANVANEKNIPSIMSFFESRVAREARAKHGPAAIVSATNVFAHIENVHDVVDGITTLLGESGVFISESHYLLSLVETLQYDTIYHEHLRYYSLTSLSYLLRMHGLEVFHAKRIPTHGGSIRVYAAKAGSRAVQPSVRALLDEEAARLLPDNLAEFKRRVALSKLQLMALLFGIKEQKARVVGVGAPSRATTLINYVGLDAGIVDSVLEIQGSYKIGKYMPGTLIPVVDEAVLFEEQPDYALLFSWHIADELIPKLKQRGFRGRFIVPLPEARIVG